MTTKQILEENDRRLAKLLAPYDPLTGEGSPIERFPLQIYKDEPGVILLPKTMEYEYAGIDSLQACVGPEDFEETLMELTAARVFHDFEFWSATCAKITDKESDKIIPFYMNLPQRELFEVTHEMYTTGDQMVREKLLKARQFGGSTFYEMFFGWVQLTQYENWNSVIIADKASQARNIRGMYTRLLQNYPQTLGNYILSPFEGSTNNRIIKGRGCIQSVGSYQEPEAQRSFDIRLAHLTEIGLWEKTVKKKPEDVISAVSSAVPQIPGTAIVYESTAKGVGNFFYRSWMAGETGKDKVFRNIFIPWFKIPFDLRKFRSDEERIRMVETLTEREIEMWNLGASFEGLNWYRYRLVELQGNEVHMKEENPSTAEEAFQSSGTPAFQYSYIKKVEKGVSDPVLVGDVFPTNAIGDECRKDLKIERTDMGNLSVWAMPNDPPIPAGYTFKGGRYVVSVDLGGVNLKSDYTAITVIDRYWMAEGGKPEIVAEWHGHLDPDLVAWKAVQMAILYDNALLIFESNSYDAKHQETEGEHGFTIIEELKGWYKNLYVRQVFDQQIRKKVNKVGFHTNTQTKPMIVNTFRKLLREDGYIERSAAAIAEARYFEAKAAGRFGAIEGQHDDILISRMIGLWVCTSNRSPMKPPKLIKMQTKPKKQTRPRHASILRRGKGGAADFG